MFLPTKYHVSIESDELLVLNENSLQRFAGCALFIALGLLWTSITILNVHSPATKSHQIIHIYTLIGPCLIGIGVIPLISRGTIVINSTQKTVTYKGGIRRYLFSPLIIPFSQVSHIKLKESFSGSHAIGNFTDILLMRKGKSGILLDYSQNTAYINEMSRKMANRIDCQVHSERA